MPISKLDIPPNYTTAELIAFCEDAIAKILSGGLEVELFPGNRVVYADLKDIRALKEELEAKQAAENLKSTTPVIITRGVFNRNF